MATPRQTRKLSTDDVCRRYGISRYTVRNWYLSEEIGFPKPVSLGGRKRHYFDEQEVLKWELRRAGLNPDAPESIHGYEVISRPIVDYAGFVEAMRKRREGMKLPCAEVDARSGLQEGYTNKLENPEKKYGRGVGPDTMPLWLGGLRCALVLVALPRATNNFKNRVGAPIGGQSVI